MRVCVLSVAIVTAAVSTHAWANQERAHRSCEDALSKLESVGHAVLCGDTSPTPQDSFNERLEAVLKLRPRTRVGVIFSASKGTNGYHLCVQLSVVSRATAAVPPESPEGFGAP